MRPCVAIDFDGTIAVTDYPAILAPIPEALEFIKACRLRGVAVILWTCRTDSHLIEALVWCDMQGIEFDAVNENLPDWISSYQTWQPDVNPDCRKICASIYIDDRNLGGINWEEAFNWLSKSDRTSR